MKKRVAAFILLITATCAFAAVEKGPYMIWNGDNTTMTVLWQFDLDGPTTSSIKWGTTTEYEDSAATNEYGDNHQHQYTITGLTPGTKYCYSVPDVGTGSFTAAPPDDAQSVNFFVYGDTRSNPGDHDSVCGGMINSYTSDPLKQTIAILTGDFVTDGRIEDNWSDEFFPRNRDSLLQFQSEIVMCGPRGNHEYNGVLFDKYFPQPWVSDFYYSFDYGPVHVVVIDNFISYDPGSPQHNWIMSDLAASNKTWKIVTFHEPGWSSGIHSNNIDVQDYLQPLCIQYGVDIVLCGHNHNYQRAVVDGVHHITSGGGGAPLYDPVPGADSVVTQLRTLHFCEISINGHTLNFTARRPDGTEIETFQVTHTPLSPTVTLTAPSEGEELTVGNPTTISASVDAAGGTVTKVSFYADYGSGDEFLGEATEEPWEVSWPPSNTGVNVVVICTAYVAVGVSTETPSDTVTVTIVDPENPPPVADAGEDQTVTDTDGDRFETVTLDGSGSFDEGGSIESWTWKEGGIIRGTEEAFPFSFELGLHTVILEVLDNGGKTATDTMTVNVLSVTNVEPIADAGPDLHVLDADGNDNETVTLDGSGSDDPDGTIVKYEWDINNDGSYELVGYTDEPTVEYVFPIGSYTVVLRVTDNTGATHTDQVQVEVLKVVETRVAVSADDAEEDTSDDGSMDLESSDLELIEDTQQGRVQLVGIRFAGCGIPADAVIGNAYIQFTCKDASDEAVGVKIHGEAIDDASTFADVANNISDRDTTAASVVWEIPEWANEESAGPDERTPDLSAILQEIVNRPGYTPASAIAFIVSGTSGTRNAHSRDKGLDVAPLLHVEYSGGDPIIYPTCTITAPTEGATFTSPATVTITADAADGDGSIANVAFYTGTMLLGEVAGHSSSDLYTIDWSDVGVGTYSLTAVATDNDGLTTTSDAVSITVDPPAGVTIVNRPIAASADDAEERSSGSSSGSMDLISSDLELIQDGSRDQEVGVRFTGCDIPQGAVIISAYIQFTCKEESSDATIVTINGEAVDDAQQFTSDDFNISTRPRTGASAAWEIPEWVAEGDAGPAERTPELSAIIQEIVNRSLYTSSGAFVFIFTGSGGGTHNAYSFDEDDPVAPAVLHVEYSLPTFPEITEQPIDQSVPEDSPVTFSVTATGGNLSYQWQRDGVDITDATEATYTIATTTMANNGVSFTCTVSNTAGTVMSDAAVLTVAMLAPVITVQPEYQTVFEGEAATFSISATGTDISYQWRRGGSTIAEATEDSYTTPSVTMTDDGAVFTCVVSNAAGSVESDAALLTVTELTAPVIETHPASVTVDEGSPATFTIDASGDLLTYQWRREDVDIDEATEDSYTIDAVAMDDDGAYFNCVVSNNAGSVTSDAAILTVTMLPPEITTQPVSQTVDEGATVTFTVAATGTDLSYQWRRGEGVIADAVEASYTIDAATMDDDGAEFTCVV
ncbi:MAG: metallophosphoesterase, partial [Chitinispirillaceae bacterium]|nr:metallophosphoesterase [Chitinispirillaceae bacterium]